MSAPNYAPGCVPDNLQPPTLRHSVWFGDDEPDVELMNALVAIMRWHAKSCRATEAGRVAALQWAITTLTMDKMSARMEATT